MCCFLRINCRLNLQHECERWGRERQRVSRKIPTQKTDSEHCFDGFSLSGQMPWMLKKNLLHNSPWLQLSFPKTLSVKIIIENHSPCSMSCLHLRGSTLTNAWTPRVEFETLRVETDSLSNHQKSRILVLCVTLKYLKFALKINAEKVNWKQITKICRRHLYLTRLDSKFLLLLCWPQMVRNQLSLWMYQTFLLLI